MKKYKSNFKESQFKNASDIMKAVDKGEDVYWQNHGYKVIKDKKISTLYIINQQKMVLA